MMASTAQQRPGGRDGRATLVCGLGSAHGDDQLGWQVIESLQAVITDQSISIRAVRSPAELLDWIGGIGRLIVCDACEDMGAPGAIHRWRWPDVPHGVLRSLGTHDLGLTDALALADELRQLPAETIIYGVEASAFLPGAPCSPSTTAAAARLAETIARELDVASERSKAC